MPRPKQRTPALRAHVLEQALRLLARGGVAELTARRVAACADTSTPAVYELFGDKCGLVREIFLEGFRRLRTAFDAVRSSGDPRADLVALVHAFRGFARNNPVLVEVMFARPFHDFRPGPEDVAAALSVNRAVLDRVRRCIAAGVVSGDAHDVSHVLMATVQGLAAAENAGRLGGSPQSVARRWELAIETMLAGLAPPPG